MLLEVQTEVGEAPPMASPGELVAALAEAVGLPRATLVSHDRLLRDAGLRSKSGRGRGAPKVTPRDAAHLLTALLASAEVQDSVHSVRRYAESRPRRDAGGTTGFERLGLPELAALPMESSFLDALERLIAATANGSLRDTLRLDRTGDVARAILIEVIAETPGTIAEIRIANDTGTATVIYTLPDPSDDQAPVPNDGSAWAATVARLRQDRDMAQQRRVSAHTLAQLGVLLADEAVRS